MRKSRRHWSALMSATLALAASTVIGTTSCQAGDSDEPGQSREGVRSVKQAIVQPGVFLRQVSGGYELEVQDEINFVPRGYPLVLRIGSLVVGGYDYSETVGMHGLVFHLSQQQFDDASDGDAIAVSYGVDGPGREYGVLDKSAVEVSP